MILDSGFPSSKWDLVLRAAVFSYNRTPHRSNAFKIPLQKFNPKLPCHTKQIKIFDCVAYMLLPKTPNTSKFSQRAIRVIFVGYKEFFTVGFSSGWPLRGQYGLSTLISLVSFIILTWVSVKKGCLENIKKQQYFPFAAMIYVVNTIDHLPKINMKHKESGHSYLK